MPPPKEYLVDFSKVEVFVMPPGIHDADFEPNNTIFLFGMVETCIHLTQK